MIHVSGNKLAIDKNEVEWSFPEINEVPDIVNKTVAAEESTYKRTLVHSLRSLIGYDLSGVTISFNPDLEYYGGGDNDLTVSTIAFFQTSGGYKLIVDGPPEIKIKDGSGATLFTFYTYGTEGTLGTTSTGSYNYTFPNDAGIITTANVSAWDATSPSPYSDKLAYENACRLITGPAELLSKMNSAIYDSYTPLTDNNVDGSYVENVTSFSSRFVKVFLNNSSVATYGNKLIVGLPSCPTVASFATDSTYCSKLISHYYSTTVIGDINTTSYLANAEYGLTVSSSTSNLPVSVTASTRIHLKNKNFYYGKSTSYPYIVQELTYLDSTQRGRKFERFINYRSSMIASDWGTWYETSANRLVLTDNSSLITGNKTFIGENNFGPISSFQYSGIGTGTADANSPIWFSDDTLVGRPVKNDSFKYNPAVQQLQIGTSNNASVQLSGCTLQYNSSSKSLSFNFN